MISTKFPDIERVQSQEEKIKMLTEYLWQFHQEVKHEFKNLSTANFNEKTLKGLASAIREEKADETTEA